MASKIIYTPVATPITLTIKRGPLNFTPYFEGRVHDNLGTSGAARERVTEHLDILIEWQMPHMVIGDDIEAWASFEAWALVGGGFQFYPSTALGDYYNCVAEDSGWKPQRNGPAKYGATVRIRILNDAQAPADPSVVLRRFYGLTG
jgi:hypothetical protein